jgi:predicted nicotinamide N-methyase
MNDEAARERFIREQTVLEPLALVPEIALHLATSLSPLWAATQSTLDTAEMEPPFWAFAWAGGQALARYVLDEPSIVKGQRVLDFATGSGLVGVAAALAGATRVEAVDIDPLACTAARINAGAAGLRLDVACVDLVGQALPEVDVLLAGDVFYDRSASRRFDPWFRALAASGKIVVVGDPGRAYLPEDLAQVAVYQVPVSFEIESRKAMHTKIWRYPR